MFQKIISTFLIFILLFSYVFAWTGENDENFLSLENSENIVEKNIFDDFEIKFRFVNITTLVDRNEIKEEYNCEKGKSCSVKINLDPSFDKNFKKSNFECEINNEAIKCDATQKIDILEAEKDINIKIFDKNDRNLFKEKIIKILNSNFREEKKDDENKTKAEKIEKSTWTLDEKIEETNTWIIEDTNSWEREQINSWSLEEENEYKKNFLENFEIKNIFQRPTYLLDKDEEKDEYFCENKECKVNFDFSSSFSEKFQAKDFSCEFTYLWEKIENCNPNTIIFWDEKTEVSIKIFNKKNKEIFKEKIIKILNKKEIEEEKEEIFTWIIEENSTNSGKVEQTNSWILDEEKIDVKTEKEEKFSNNFKIKNIFQKWTTLLDISPEKTEFLCNKWDCKVNFDFRQSFSEDFLAKNFSCELEFSGEILKTCNPSSIEIPLWETEFLVKIFNKKDKNLFKTEKYLIKNNWDIAQSRRHWSEETKLEKKIEVKSGLVNKKCEKSDCKVDFYFENKNRNLTCKWNFWRWIFKEKADEKCNPSAVLFDYWDHFVSLKVFDKKSWNLVFEDFLEFKNEFENWLSEEKIILQWKSLDFQKWKNLAFCFWESCKLNFSVSNISKTFKKSYQWDFENWEKFSWKNPWEIEFKKWKYKVSLKIVDEKNEEKELFFYVVVDDKEDFFREFFKNDEKNFLEKIKISKRQNNFSIISENNLEKIEKTFDFWIFWDLFFDEELNLAFGENETLKQDFSYDDIWEFIFKFYNLDWNTKTEKLEVNYKDFFLFELKKFETKIEKTRKEKPKKEDEEKNLKIILQWKKTKSKKYFDKKVVCFWICTVNFWLETNIKLWKNINWYLNENKFFTWKNPKSLKFETWKHKIKVEFLAENGEKIEDYFEIIVNKKLRKTITRRSKKIKKWPVVLKISVQGRASKNKILAENSLICLWPCSINFDWRASSGAYKELIWDFWNGEKFIWENPKSVKYKDFWEYKISLKSFWFDGKLYEKIFFVEVKQKEKNLEKTEEIDENENFSQERLKKDDLFFILIIIILFYSFGFILLKRHKII